MLLTQKYMQNMPRYIEDICREYAQSLPGLREKGIELELRSVRASVHDVLRMSETNRHAALLGLTQWTEKKETDLMAEALKPNRNPDDYNAPLNALANLNSLLAAALTGADGVKDFVPKVETMGVALNVAEEVMLADLKLVPEVAAKVKERMLTIKAGAWGKFKRRGAGENGLQSVAFGKIRIVFNPRTGEITKVGQIKDVYSNSRSRN